MKKNSFIYEDYPPEWTLGLPAKWIFVAEDMLNEDLFKEWLFYAMRYYGFCGIWKSDNTYVNMLLNAVYNEDEQFFDQYYNSLLKKRTPIDQLLKVNNVHSKEDQLNAYSKRQGKWICY